MNNPPHPASGATDIDTEEGMHQQAKQPGDLGDLINGWVCGIGLPIYLAWHFAQWVRA